MIQAMYSGISGMRAFKANLDVIGNNIANVNTVSYKAGRTTFKEMLCHTMAGASAPTDTLGGKNPTQVGLGVITGTVDWDYSQGSMQATGRQTDLAIEGDGFFVLDGPSGITYTRDGSFSLDAQNNLVSSATGLRVLGWSADLTTGEINTSSPITSQSTLQIPVGSLSIARQTTLAEIGGNLDASAAEGSEHSVRFEIFDSLGDTHELSIMFTKTANPSEWSYDVYCADVDPVAAVTSGVISFDTDGASELESLDISLVFSEPNGSTSPLTATINTSELAQRNGQMSADLAYQNGLPLGTLDAFTIDRNGIVTGTFTNGATLDVGQIGLATFRNPAGLSKMGSNLLTKSANSGPAQIGTPGTAGRGCISAGFLEASNVDLANEFANLIVAQRGFQANSRIITVSDEVLQDLVSMKR